MDATRNPRVCLESWEEELKSRANRVRRLIGDAHWLSDGNHKESLVREFLRRHLSPTLAVNRGFVVSQNEPICSGELDIVIADFNRDLPWLNEGDLMIIPPRCCMAQIHVKTEFGVNELQSVLKSTNKALSVIGEKLVPHVFSAAVFFERTNMRDASDYKDTLVSALAKANYSVDFPHPNLPEVIAIIDGPVLIRADQSSDLPYNAFQCGNLSIAVLLAKLNEKIAATEQLPETAGNCWDLLSLIEYKRIF